MSKDTVGRQPGAASIDVKGPETVLNIAFVHVLVVFFFTFWIEILEGLNALKKNEKNQIHCSFGELDCLSGWVGGFFKRVKHL